MDERELRRMDRRGEGRHDHPPQFTRTMVGLGLTAPMAAQMLASAGVAQAQTKPAFKPTKRGGGGELKMLWWQAPTLLNPHLAVGVKDKRRLPDLLRAAGRLRPRRQPGADAGRRGAEPSRTAAWPRTGTSVTWKLKNNVQWHDGKPFTADDVVFTWEFAADPATAATTLGAYKDIERSRRSTATPSSSSSRSRRRSGPTPSAARAA